MATITPISTVSPIQIPAVKPAQTTDANKPFILIIGGGVAGLIRAIIAVKNGNRVVVVEKRSEGHAPRQNTVRLERDAIDVLKEHGIYDYLIRNGLCFPDSKPKLMVRLGDLEKAMKAVLGNSIISYDSEVTTIARKVDELANVVVKTKEENSEVFKSYRPDLMVVADGAQSSTLKQLGIDRVEVLPKVPVVAAIFRDNRPKIESVSTFFKYIGLSVKNLAVMGYYISLFVFKMLFQGEHIFNSNRKIVGGILLKTPGQHYMGYCLNRQESQKLIDDAQIVTACQSNLKSAELGSDAAQTQVAKKALDRAVKQRDDRIAHYAYLSFVFSNIFALVQRSFAEMAWWKPIDLDRTRMITIGADKAAQGSGQAGKTPFIIVGDALATVDPTTGKGARTAISSSKFFQEIISNANQGEAVRNLIANHDAQYAEIVDKNHQESKAMRQLYRPDAV